MSKIKELNIFDEFLSQNIAEELDKNGVVMVNDYISKENCLDLKNLLGGSQLKNSHELTFVYLDDAKFFSNAIAQSQTAYNLVTSKNTLHISKKYLGENIRLKCHRAYSTKKNYFFPWHTDNKFDDIKNNRKGIVFIIYLVDTFHGATEFVLGSHKESSKFENNNFLDSFIETKFKNRIAKAKGKKGCAIISDTRVIHRGSIEKGEKIERYSFWFQIDSDTNEAERLLLNPEFLPRDISPELTDYLGFSKNFGLKVHPNTTNVDKFIPYDERFKMFYKYFFLILSIPFNWLRLKLPLKTKVKIKNILKKKNDWN